MAGKKIKHETDINYILFLFVLIGRKLNNDQLHYTYHVSIRYKSHQNLFTEEKLKKKPPIYTCNTHGDENCD